MRENVKRDYSKPVSEEQEKLLHDIRSAMVSLTPLQDGRRLLAEFVDRLSRPAPAPEAGIREAAEEAPPTPEPTHRCKVCGALWKLWQPGEAKAGDAGSWSLVSARCGKCCDIVALATIPSEWDGGHMTKTPAIVGIQSCGMNGRAAHMAKLEEPTIRQRIDAWILCGGRAELWAWRRLKSKRGGKAVRWSVERTVLS